MLPPLAEHPQASQSAMAASIAFFLNSRNTIFYSSSGNQLNG
jgi:hypothetical protein